MKSQDTYLKLLKWSLWAHLFSIGCFIADYTHSLIPKIMIAVTGITYGGFLIYGLTLMSKDIAIKRAELKKMLEDNKQIENPE